MKTQIHLYARKFCRKPATEVLPQSKGSASFEHEVLVYIRSV